MFFTVRAIDRHFREVRVFWLLFLICFFVDVLLEKFSFAFLPHS